MSGGRQTRDGIKLIWTILCHCNYAEYEVEMGSLCRVIIKRSLTAVYIHVLIYHLS